MKAKIGLKDVRVHAPHGFYSEEHKMGNEFSIDVEVTARIGLAAEQDDLGQTVNYGTIFQLLQLEMKKPTRLLEALAYRMAARIADQFDNVLHVKLRLHKLHPPLGGSVGSSWVEVEVASPGGFSNHTGLNDARTFDEYIPHFDVDGPFASPGSGTPTKKAPPKPRPVAPLPPYFDEDIEGLIPTHLLTDDDGDFAEHADGHAVSDEDPALEEFNPNDKF